MARISEYGLVGNGRTAALISLEGSIEWCCFPHFNSPSFFAAILDPDRGGHFSIRPALPCERSHRYRPDTNILETRFVCDEGEALLTDAFTVSSEERKRRALWPDQEILRIVEGIRGEVPFRLEFAPKPSYGDPAASFRFELRPRFGIACMYRNSILLLRSSLPPENFKMKDSAAVVEFRVRAGEQLCFSLVYTEEGPAVLPPLSESALERMDETATYWQRWISRCVYRGPYEEQVRRSALALKLLIFAPSGAVVAAPTSSLPEVLKGKRNWDYRYCWLRDAAFTVRALVDLGYYEEAGTFVSWMLHSTNLTRPRLQILYDVYGHARLDERELPWLGGYEGARPVRIGNAAGGQFQLDVYGEVLEGVFHFSPYAGEFDGATRRFLFDLGRSIEELWEQPDDGIWETRENRAHYTHSKALAWAGLTCLGQLCERHRWSAPVARYAVTAARIRTTIEESMRRLGHYTRKLDDSELDASLLALPLIDYCRADEPAMIRTTEAIGRDLSRGGLIYRYRVDDGMEGEEGCFGICSFWMVDALARAGRQEDARKWMNSTLRFANPLGLWSEEIEPRRGLFLGNYPQAFTHIGLINAAVTFADMERKERAS